MKEYIDYKAWWIETQSPHIFMDECQNSEEMFKEHVNELGFYRLMELLADNYQEVPDLGEAVASLENYVERINDKINHIDTSNDWMRQ
jgi:hypothetical protein